METQQGFTLWLTGMSGAGKSTLANYLAKRLPLVGRRVEVLDMSELEEILPEEPDSSREVRDRNVRQLGWMARVLTRNGITPIVAAVSPYRELREEQRREIGRFFEIFVDCSFEVLMERDSKGIYRRALSGELQDVVGVQSPYEPPTSAEVKVDMGRGSVEEVAKEVFDRMVNHGYLSRKERDILVNGSAPAKAAKAKREAKIEVIRAAAKKAKKARGEESGAPKAAKAGAKAKATSKTDAKAKEKSGAKPGSTATAAKPGAKTTKAAPAKAAKETKAAASKPSASSTGAKAAGGKSAAPKAAKSAAGTKSSGAKAAKAKGSAATKPAAAKPAGAKPAKSKAVASKAAKPAAGQASKASPSKAKASAARTSRKR